MIAGGLLIIANCFYFWYSVYNKIEIASIVIVSFIAIIFIIFFIVDPHNEFQLVGGSLSILALMLFITFGGKLPSVTLDSDVIKMGGSFGGSFKVSAIQSIDTVNVYPRVGIRSNGAGFPASSYGNFALEKESKTAKLCIYKNNPPYIKIRMNDNSLFILNFKEPEKTVEFYNQIIDAINSH